MMGRGWNGRRRGSKSDAPSKDQTVVLVDFFLLEVVKLALGKQHHQKVGSGFVVVHGLSHFQTAVKQMPIVQHVAGIEGIEEGWDHAFPWAHSRAFGK